MQNELTEQVAEFVAKFKYDTLEQEAVERAKVTILDCTGVALAGSSSTAGRIMAKFARDSSTAPVSTVIGQDFKTSTITLDYTH